MSSMKDKMIRALKQNAFGNIQLHKMNIEVYLDNPAGIGEHSDIMEAIQGELDKIAIHEDRLAVLDGWIGDEDDDDGL